MFPMFVSSILAVLIEYLSILILFESLLILFESLCIKRHILIHLIEIIHILKMADSGESR